MTIRSLLLASTVLPFALSYPALALDKARALEGPMILAQAETTCPEGQECPPAGEAVPAEETAPATTEEPAASDTPAATETAPAEAPAATTTEEPAAGQGNRRQRALDRARRQQEELQQQQTEQPAAEQAPAATQDAPAATQEAPAAEAPAAVEPTQEPAAAETPTAQEPAATTGEAPAAEQPAAGETRQQRRARLRAERQQQQQGGAAQEQPAAQPEAGQPAAAGAAPAAAGESTVEQQLEAQGDTEQANQIRQLRRKLRQERANADGEAPAAAAGEAAPEPTAAENDRAERRRERREERGGRVVEERGDRIIIDLGGTLVIERAGPDEGERLLYGARDVRVEELPGGVTRTIVFRENGSQIITERTNYGEIIRRVRLTPDGREVVLIDNRIPVVVEGAPPVVYQPLELAPLRVEIPQEQYIVDLGQASQQDVQAALLAPPVQRLERAYTLEEVTRNEGLRAYVPRIDLDTITFAFGSATIGTDQMAALENLGTAMEEVLIENPDEVYLIEGHTDAVGSDYDNLILSDQRAEAVAVALSQNFDIPPENLVTEGYGEQYLKVETDAEERQNRRVTVRRITPLLSAEAQQ